MGNGATPEAWRLVRSVPRPDSLRRLFSDDPNRAERFTLEVADLRVDVSKQIIDDRVLDSLMNLFASAGVESSIDALFAGDAVNVTEGRAAGHPALRRPIGMPSVIGRADVSNDVHAVLADLRSFAASVISGSTTSVEGRRFETVVNIGIGGSDLGPAMAYEALRGSRGHGLSVRFVANVDPADLAANLTDLDPRTTLFVVSSKTFTTAETMANAVAARRWIESAVAPGDSSRHFVAVTTNETAAREFGVAAVFRFWDWVGGRYSLASAIGLSLMLGVGPRAFDEMLSGMHAIDEHVRTTTGRLNLAVVLAAVGIWNRNVLGHPTKVVLPYSHDLRRFPAYLQQLDMESNGKSASVDGTQVGLATGPVIWGEPGTNAQHAFMQSLHQGTDIVPVDFIGFAEPSDAVDDDRHETLFLNMLAQSRALAFGRTLQEVSDSINAVHRVFPGDRPSTTIVARRLDPSVLGQLIALYEHVVHIQGVVWGINSFDQFGVELGKELARDLATSDGRGTDSSTHSLLQWYRRTVGS
ncbi:MAG: glucose-6-phosphate isomerase [Actinomycetota bacterium]